MTFLSATSVLAASAESPTDTQQYSGFIGWVLDLIDKFGEIGVGLALAIESLLPPVPSELILPVAGYLAYEGKMNFWLIMLCAAVGSMISSYVYYFAGYYFGRERTRWLFEKIPLLETKDFDLGERVFSRWGGVAVFVGRCVPLVRSAISIPAGIEKMSLWKFSLYTLTGSVLWNGIWVGLGFGFGPRIDPILTEYSGLLSNFVLGVIAALLLWFVIARVIKRIRKGPSDDAGTPTDTVILQRVK
ncbi:DedA family protein [Glycomyces buryatensis]|uniref:DedA family protein n=1 Tax=Glycomyces buryatensis TaxID=2570927 RepID=A0A4S8QBI6_9ACTN|nr:DedA family protein [Glycomyces buryatensis]THV41857.1 DedA family protein [Glycomyces buryatensis]